VSQQGLFGERVGDAHDVLQRFYTPTSLAEMVAAVVGTDDGLDDLRDVEQLVEPSVGGGAIARALRRVFPLARLQGLDVDPGARGFDDCHDVEVVDFVAWTRRASRRVDAVIGNPPFDGALEHVLAAFTLRPRIIAFVLPHSLWGVDGWQSVLDAGGGGTRPWTYRPIKGRPWDDHMREVGLYEWRPHERVPSFTRTIPMPDWRVRAAVDAAIARRAA
jgi:hypothetical protein